MSTTERLVKQLRQEIGELQETQRNGLSRDELRGFVGRFSDFCREILGLDLTPQQTEAAQAMSAGVTQLQVVGGNGLGKDTLTAARAIYEAFVMRALALLTGPSDRQVREVMMRREVGRLLRAARGKLRYERFTMAVHIPGEDVAGILAFTASDPDKFTGHHHDRVFIGMTEGQGVPEEIWKAAQKCRVGDGLFLAVGNPNAASGPFYNASRASTWQTLFWSGLDHPNVVHGDERIPGGPTVEWVEQMRAEYGEDSPFYVSAVLGQFPTEGSIDSLIRKEWLEPAYERHDATAERPWRGPVPVAALDVARSVARDESVTAIAQGPRLHSFHTWRVRDGVKTAERFLNITDRARLEWHLARINQRVDPDAPILSDTDKLNTYLRTIGVPEWELHIDTPGPGTGVVDECRRRGRRVEEFWPWNPPSDSRRLANRRAECGWTIRTLLEGGRVALPRDPLFEEEALAMEYTLDAKGRVLLIAKDDLRKRLGRSPDRWDSAAIALTAADGGLRGSTVRFPYSLQI